MKIQTILEKAKFAKQKTIAYHGTSKKHLKSIIEKGLIMNHSENGLGSGEYDERGFGYSFEPHEGIYFSTNWRNGVNNAKNVDHNNPIVIVAQIQMKSAYLDEDDIFEVVGIDDSRILRKISDAYQKYNPNEDEEYEKFYNEVEDIEKEEQKHAINSLRDNLRTKYNINPTSVEHMVKQAIPALNNFVSELVTAATENTEADIRAEQDALRKILKNIPRQHDIKNVGGENTNFSVPYNIGFKGANRIIGIVDINADKVWGYHPNKQYFTEVKDPMELLH